jgi:hypothetical protein
MSYGFPIDVALPERNELIESLRRNDLPDIANILLLGMPADEAVSLASLRAADSIKMRLPAIADLTSFTNAEQMAAAKYAQEVKMANDITRQQNRESTLLARARDRAAQRIAERG